MNKKIASWVADLPDQELEMFEPNLNLFFQTMFERQEIWFKRFMLKSGRPWTNDKFLRDHKFTNVYRELDRNSQWQIKNIFLKEKSRKELLWKIMLFRFINQPDFFDWMASTGVWGNKPLPDYSEFDSEVFYQAIIDYRATGNNPFTNAYLINSQSCPGKTRDHCYGYKVIPTLHNNIGDLLKILLKAKTPQEIIKFLKTLPAVADFIAHEFYQDFTYAYRYSGIRLTKFNQDDFTNVGPGASIGIRLIFPNLKGKVDQELGIYLLRDLAEECLSEFGNFKYLEWNSDKQKYFTTSKCNITLHQIEMWLCEFQKYWKMQIGKGKQRSKFTPQTKYI